MAKSYPIKFTLEDGVHVSVSKSAEDTYEFTLTGKEGTRNFTYKNDGLGIKEEEEQHLDFDQLNAVRRFWLEEHSVI